MGTVSTTAIITATAYGNQREIDRCQNGVLWAIHGGGSRLFTNYSTDNGVTWSSDQSYIGTNGSSYQNDGSLFIDLDDYAHVAYRDSTDGYLYYVRGTPNTARTAYTWSTPTVLYQGSIPYYPDIVAHRDPSTSGAWIAHVVASYVVNALNRTIYVRINISSTGAVTLPAGVNSPTSLNSSYNQAADTYPSIDFRHTGDAKTVAGGSPDLFVGWSAGTTGSGYGIRFKKATYSAGSWTWGTEREIDNTVDVTANTYLNCMFDGTRVVLAGFLNTSPTFKINTYDRDAADTTTTPGAAYVTGSTGGDYLQYGSASYDAQGNIYLFGEPNTGTAGSKAVGYQKWTRATNTLGAFQTIASNGNSGPYLSARRGYAGSRIDYVYTSGTASPYSVTSGSVVLNTAPNAPTLTAPASGASIDRTIAQTLAWTFSDPDAGDTESAFDLQYRVQGTTTWTTVSQTTTATSSTFAANAFTAGATYEWQVRSYDSQGAVGPWSSSSFFTAATPPAAPTITAPTSGATISAATATVTWSAPSQAHYQVRRVGDISGSPDTSTVYWDSGDVVDSTSRALSVAFPTNGRTEHVQVRIQTSGIWSPWADARVVISYTPPSGPTITLVPQAGTASILVVIVNPAGGTAVDHNDVAVNDGAGLSRRATGVPANGSWTYWLPVSGRDYTGGNVQVTAVAANGTTTSTSS